jgi:mRNA interferase MazF
VVRVPAVPKREYVPDRGDIIWIDFDRLGHEQSGDRPALVLSPGSYNRRIGFALVCPITSKCKGYVFEVRIQGKKIDGVVLSDQITNVDWRTRGVRRIETASDAVVLDVAAKILTLLPTVT